MGKEGEKSLHSFMVLSEKEHLKLAASYTDRLAAGGVITEANRLKIDAFMGRNIGRNRLCPAAAMITLSFYQYLEGGKGVGRVEMVVENVERNESGL
jgi:hypothetical protein